MGIMGQYIPNRRQKDVFLQSLPLLKAGHNPCQRRQMAISTDNGLVNGPGHNLLMQFFTLGHLKNRSFRNLPL